jgi:hypothetical protein
MNTRAHRKGNHVSRFHNRLLPPGSAGAQFARFRKSDGSHFNIPYAEGYVDSLKKLTEAGHLPETDLPDGAADFLKFIGVEVERADGFVEIVGRYAHVADVPSL